MDKRYNDTDLREALRRKYADTPQMSADFMVKMEGRMNGLQAGGGMDGGENGAENGADGRGRNGADGKTVGNKRAENKYGRLWGWIAAAASVLLIIGVGVHYQFKGDSHAVEQPSALNQPIERTQSTNRVHSVEQPSTLNQPIERTQPSNRVHSTNQSSALNQATERTQSTNRVHSIEQPSALDTDPNLHYASHDLIQDSVSHQAPSRVDDFIAKLADYHKVKPVVLDCSGEARDTSIVGTAYLFNDTQELDLFGRLLQVACCYDTKTPGYLLNFSHQQFFFCLKDLGKQEKYLWIAERINGGRILLFSTHSPIEAEVSSACFQAYREQLTHTNIKMLQF